MRNITLAVALLVSLMTLPAMAQEVGQYAVTPLPVTQGGGWENGITLDRFDTGEEVYFDLATSAWCHR